MPTTRTDFPSAHTPLPTQGMMQFGSYSLDPQNEQLWCDQHTVRLTGKSFAVLQYFVERPNQLITKRDLFRAVWSDTVISHSTLTSCIKELRKALKDDARAPQYIETVHRRGYRFITPVVATATPVSDLRGHVSGVSAEEQQAQHGPWVADRGTPVIRRIVELAQLHEWLDKAFGDQRQVMFVTGEAGPGKMTRLEVLVSGGRSS